MEVILRAKVIILLVLLFLFVSYAYAGWSQKPEFRLSSSYRYDLRQDFRNLYIDRVYATFSYLNDKKQPLLKLIPFFEIRRNIEGNLWERKELGVEVGKDFFSWVYLGESIQYVWTQEDLTNLYHPVYEKKDYMESETRLLFSHNLLSSRYLKLKGFVLNEYTYDFEQGRGVRNEVAIGLIMPVDKYFETQINWRHIDRINYYDSDTVEAVLALVF